MREGNNITAIGSPTSNDSPNGNDYENTSTPSAGTEPSILFGGVVSTLVIIILLVIITAMIIKYVASAAKISSQEAVGLINRSCFQMIAMTLLLSDGVNLLVLHLCRHCYRLRKHKKGIWKKTPRQEKPVWEGINL